MSLLRGDSHSLLLTSGAGGAGEEGAEAGLTSRKAGNKAGALRTASWEHRTT